MNILKNKFILLMMLIGCITIGSALFQLSNSNTEELNTSSEYQKTIANKEQEVWNSLQSAGINRDEFQSFYADYLPGYLKEDANTPKRQVSPEVLSVIHEVMHDLNIDPATVTITTFDDGSPAAATDSLLLINESKFKALSKESQLFALAHEFQHMKFKDGSTICALQETINQQDIKLDASSADSPFNQFSRFIETRADTNAALLGPKYAHAFVTYVDEAIKRNGENAGISHPKNSERLALAQNIYSSMQTA